MYNSLFTAALTSDNSRLPMPVEPSRLQPLPPQTCCACTGVATARVEDGDFLKPVCESHVRMYARQGYSTRPKN